MDTTLRIREICERNARLLEARPAKGHLTGVTRARMVQGLRCEITEGEWTLAADMPGKAGGGDSAPTPGMLGRGALAGCLAIGITMWAARLGVPLDGVEVEVQADFDARGELGVGDAKPGYREVRRIICIDSPAPAQVLQDLVDTAERHSPYLDVFARGQSLTRELRLAQLEEA
jgi:uncharacterized OsmC-like protein